MKTDQVAVGFTGASFTTAAQAAYVRDVIHRTPATDYVSGACTGVDTVAACAVAELWPDTHSMILVPGELDFEMDAKFLADMTEAPAVSFIRLPAGSTYSHRNQRIVDLSDRIVAFPPFGEEDPRSVNSGTWETIRMAIAAGLPIDIHILTEVTT